MTHLPYTPYRAPVFTLPAPRHYDPYWAFLAITLLVVYGR